MPDQAKHTEHGAPQDAALYAAVAAFVRDARTNYLEVVNDKTYIPQDTTFPTIRTFADSGFPNVSAGIDAAVPDYQRLFGLEQNQWAKIAIGEWESWQRLINAIEGNERLMTYLAFGSTTQGVGQDDARRALWLASIKRIPLKIFNRLMHLHGIDFTDEQLMQCYLPVETALLDDRLRLSFVVPIALTHFGHPGDVFDIDEGVSLVKLSEEVQLARMPRSQFGVAVNSVVLSAATHGVAFSDWSMTNSHELASGDEDLDWYPLDTIDRFFHALRIVTGIETGYAQVFIEPLDWSKSWRASLPPIEPGALGRRYPAHFEKFGWLRRIDPVAEADVHAVAHVYRSLATAPARIQLAASRLSAAMLREDETDKILDLCIGLEAALGDGSTTEATHKLSLRAAAVLSLDDDEAIPVATAVYRDIKDIYNYRSAVVHGSSNVAKLRQLRDAQGERDPARIAGDVAAEHLRRVLRVLLTRPELHDGKAIDEQLVLPALQRYQPQAPTTSSEHLAGGE